MHTISAMLVLLLLALSPEVHAQSTQVVDLPSRPGVTQRILVIKPDQPKAAVVLFAGGDGAIALESDGRIGKLTGNFLIRTRGQFAAHGLLTVVIDAPSDVPHLGGTRQTAKHVADVKAVLAWLRAQATVPVWLVGTSRGTQSVAYIATQLSRADGGPDGIVLTSSVVSDKRSRAVPEMPLELIHVPVLVTHHKEDSCRVCRYGDVPLLMDKLTTPPRRELIVFEGGVSEGDPCGARAYHGYNGIEREVVDRIAAWILQSASAPAGN